MVVRMAQVIENDFDVFLIRQSQQIHDEHRILFQLGTDCRIVLQKWLGQLRRLLVELEHGHITFHASDKSNMVVKISLGKIYLSRGNVQRDLQFGHVNGVSTQESLLCVVPQQCPDCQELVELSCVSNKTHGTNAWLPVWFHWRKRIWFWIRFWHEKVLKRDHCVAAWMKAKRDKHETSTISTQLEPKWPR